MPLRNQFALPDIAREGLTPPELELLAWVQQLAAIANGLQDEVEQLKQEAAQLRKARKRA
ncbi:MULTISPECIES: hypothetical protein [unclassified Caballeronia]|jgi:hypothetical protein|uniref:hypothetical protein n=1 Tax=unclassified Caballeronia TaxID=2646786 RepID=UPI0013E9CABE|nr:MULTISPECIES: hypothetical protein [unclassified Caballeronia]